MIDLGIAFESLYLYGINSKTELRFRFSLHAALYLGKDKKHREALLKKFKEIYDWRSSVVHKGELSKKQRNDPEKIEEFITNAQNLCRDTIKKILKNNEYPNWNDLILNQ